MAITLQVVGIFFGAELPLEGEQRVIDVLEAAARASNAGTIKNVTAFAYETSSPPRQSAISFTAIYSEPVKGRAIGREYPAGEYFLAEDLSAKPAYNVWQYYVLNADKTPVVRGVKFLDDKDATVPAGGTLIWRLVSILHSPNSRPAIASARQFQGV